MTFLAFMFVGMRVRPSAFAPVRVHVSRGVPPHVYLWPAVTKVVTTNNRMVELHVGGVASDLTFSEFNTTHTVAQTMPFLAMNVDKWPPIAHADLRLFLSVRHWMLLVLPCPAATFFPCGSSWVVILTRSLQMQPQAEWRTQHHRGTVSGSVMQLLCWTPSEA